MYRKMILLLLLVVHSVNGAEVSSEEKVRVYLLSNEEALLTPHQLFLKGKRIFNTDAQEKTVGTSFGNVRFKSSDNKNNAMRYLIPSGKSGHIEAATIAYEYLMTNGFYPNSRAERFALADSLHKNNEVYGTFMLANCYRYGIGTGMNLDIAQELFKKVISLCKRDKKNTISKLSYAGKSGYDRCLLADANYNALVNIAHERIPVVNTENIKKQESINKLMQSMIDSKKEEAFNKYAK